METVKHRFVTHVFKRGDEWIVRAESATAPLSTHRTKGEALRAAITIAHENEPSQVKIHKEDGTFEEERTYGDDPFPPKG
jgi:hypothetical protein